MDWHAISSLIGALTGVAALIIALKKSPHETANIDADADKKKAEGAELYQKIADGWAKQVEELQSDLRNRDETTGKLQDEVRGLRLDIAQVRRENESYRQQLDERDAIIADLKHWAEQLTALLKQHAPDVVPPEFIRTRKVIHV